VQGDRYYCQNLVTDKIEDYHVTRLRKFRYDERYVDPRDIALRDRDEFYVEKILAHCGDVGILKTLAFHVKTLFNPSWFSEINSGKVSGAVS
jgi:hypothetical protein